MKSLPILTEAQVRKFWSKVQSGRPQDCWEWQGCTAATGYGRFSIQNNECLAHRVAFFLHNEVDPQDSFVRQTCKNKKCCNPSHLRLNEIIKLGPVQVRYIRGQAAKGVSVRTLAAQYNVTKSTIHRITNNTIWKNV
jgi:hypothetical protein